MVNQVLKTILKRVLQAIPTLLIVVTFTFILTRMIPGNPAQTILGPQATAESIAAMETKLGLDQPKWVQYIDYVLSVLQGDFGTSYSYDQPVTELIAQRIPATLQITIIGLLIAIIIILCVIYSLSAYWIFDYFLPRSNYVEPLTTSSWCSHSWVSRCLSSGSAS